MYSAWRKASVQLHSRARQLLHVHVAPTDSALAQIERVSHKGGHVAALGR